MFFMSQFYCILTGIWCFNNVLLKFNRIFKCGYFTVTAIIMKKILVDLAL